MQPERFAYLIRSDEPRRRRDCVRAALYDRIRDDQAGYIVDVSGLDCMRRPRALRGLMRELGALGVHWLCADSPQQLLGHENAIGFLEAGFELLDGSRLGQASLCPAALKAIGGARVKRVALLGGDVPLGAQWARVLAPHVQEMTLWGQNTSRMKRLSEHLLRQWGLAAVVRAAQAPARDMGVVILADSIYERWPADGVRFAPAATRVPGWITAAAVRFPPGYVPDMRLTSPQRRALLEGYVACSRGQTDVLNSPDALLSQLRRLGVSLSGLEMGGREIPFAQARALIAPREQDDA